MRHAPPELGVRRLLLALEAGAHGADAMDAAVRLAAQTGAPLAGLFVEDIEMLKLASAPYARWLDPLRRGARAVEAGEMERALRASSDRARDVLAERAGRAGVAWSFRVARGRVVEEVALATAASDLVVTGSADAALAASSGGGSRSALLLRRAAHDVPVVAVYGGSPAAATALLVAARLAERARAELIVLLSSDAGGAAAPWQADAAARLDAIGLRARYRVLDVVDARSLLEMAGERPAAMLVIDAAAAPSDELARLLSRALSPVLVVR